MSGPFGIATVSAVLQRLLSTGLGDVDLSIFGGNATSVTVHPPDQITVGANEPAHLNLFLYKVSPNTALRNEGLPSRSGAGDRLTNPPLALDLHYLLTAYGSDEFFPEALLGYAMQVLHEVPFLSRDYIRNTWPDGGGTAVEQALAASGVADQMEYIKLTPQNLSTEELSKLWTAFQAKYRPSAAFMAAVLIIQAARGARAPLPVLMQGRNDSGPSAQADLTPPFPEALRLQLPNNQSAAHLSDMLQIIGHSFAGDTGDKTAVTVAVRIQNTRHQVDRTIAVPAASRSDGVVRFQFPAEPQSFPAGLYTLSVMVTPTSDTTAMRTSNELPLLLAPRITTNLPTTAPIGVITLALSPEVWPGQMVSLLLGAHELPTAPIQNQGANVRFDATSLPAGMYRVRVRVDGVDSLLVDRSNPKQPQFDPTQQITLQ